MTDLEKAIWKASRGVPAETAALFTELFRHTNELTALVNALMSTCDLQQGRIEALEAKRGPGRPKLLERVANGD